MTNVTKGMMLAVAAAALLAAGCASHSTATGGTDDAAGLGCKKTVAQQSCKGMNACKGSVSKAAKK